MLTAAVFFDSFREKKRNENDDVILHGERFLQELATAFQNGVFHQEDDDIIQPELEDDCTNTESESPLIHEPISEEHSVVENTRNKTRAEEDQDTRATQIQAQVRRYLQQRHFTIERLQQRLQDIAREKEASLRHIEQRKQRKLLKTQRKYDRKEERQEVEYQKVQGIRQYLQRNQVRCQRELDNLQRITQELLKENQRLLRANERTNAAVHDKKQQLQLLEASNQRLHSALEVYREMVQQLQLQISPSSGSSQTTVDLLEQTRTNHHSKAYETNIVVNSVNEVEEKCFHYRLVQDVYTLTPRAVI